ncbi:MAG: NAD(P)H-dependent oxidoreductase [Bacteroidales bacterium]|nr:NAD(P)H-dependent oxidoreductase [Bacteroidales bacterium]MCI2134251.1 NAD(P)H-dependent oxidoreductase [Bacteroidales bacterium]
MKEADIVVIGSPVYWHNICALVRTVMERFYGTIDEGAFSGKSCSSSIRELRQPR